MEGRIEVGQPEIGIQVNLVSDDDARRKIHGLS
jgi:hypothetical protein